jgi:hypothetical protein
LDSLDLKYKTKQLLNLKQQTTFTNNSFTYYYYTFNTNYDVSNIYSDLTLLSLDVKNKYWFRKQNFNIQLRTDEYENEFEELTSFLPIVTGLKQSSISNFFSSNLVDTPRCFQKSYSLYQPIYDTPHLKFLHILMRHGGKEQIFSSVFRALVSNYMYPKIHTNSDLIQ